MATEISMRSLGAAGSEPPALPRPRAAAGESIPATPPQTSVGPAPVSAAPYAVETVLVLLVGAGAAASGLLPLGLALPAVAAWPVMLRVAGHHRRLVLGNDLGTQLRRVATCAAREVVLVLAVIPWLVTPAEHAPGSLALGAGTLVGAMAVASGAGATLRSLRRHRLRLVVVGARDEVQDALAELVVRTTHRLVAVCLDGGASHPPGLDPALPTYAGLWSSPVAAREHCADAVVVLPGTRASSSTLRRVHWALTDAGAELYVATGLLDVAPERTRVVPAGGLGLVEVARPALRGARRLLKDVADRCVAAAALLLLLPVLLALGLAVRLDSPGPALYRQTRVGRDGRTFTMLKLRTMRVAADAERGTLDDLNESDGVLFKIRQDPRTTRVGAWLRQWSLDEVPQLWNVLVGDMSLVGPRPALPGEVAKYDLDPLRRLAVKPGLTGLWQVSGRSDLSWAESVRLDVKYVDNWSLRLDARILVRTVTAVLGRRGAY